ncbi:MAG: hypothetical protein LBV54_04335 [Puniceicoccales bacterium]|jgi:acyl-CoA thioesterase FadM|nr:hypothetical protein [Puniceicoccales bacterium]
MSSNFIHTHRVAFAEADPAGIAHFARFPLWVEEAEFAFWQSKNAASPSFENGVLVGWPKISFSIRHRAPARFGDIVSIALTPKVETPFTVEWKFRMTRADTLLASGAMLVIYASVVPAQITLQKQAVPENLLALLTA